MERGQGDGEVPLADELFQRVEELKESVQRFTSGKGLGIVTALILRVAPLSAAPTGELNRTT